MISTLRLGNLKALKKDKKQLLHFQTIFLIFAFNRQFSVKRGYIINQYSEVQPIYIV